MENEEGWIWGKFLRSPAGYRLGLRNENGKWRVVFFVDEGPVAETPVSPETSTLQARE
jgi:hypothetical protein